MENQTSPQFEAWIDQNKIPRASIEYKFQFYMFKMGLWGNVPTGQLLETRRAFFGGVAAMFAEMVELGDWPEDQAGKMLELRQQELERFWTAEDLKRQKAQN